ncbi:hypothetical protein [uncultured Cardiobacterium sp.]|uniref:hypothetical protein n=1 Tax=uncultured Cardiobacterium sp. TaxID=417619 RepID=UPI00263854C6|nr:hypothetical protein [uncultured Cardiobacterium sp.]
MPKKILSGKKKFEFCRTLPKNKAVKKVVIYATLPIGKVVGEFEIEELISDSPSQLWKRTAEFSGITAHFFNTYFDGRDTAYAIKVGKTKKYAKEKN